MINCVESVSLSEIVDKFNLKPLNSFQNNAWEMQKILIHTTSIRRPSILLAGINDYSDFNQLNIITGSDVEFIKTIPSEKRVEAINCLLKDCINAVIFSDNTDLNEPEWKNEIEAMRQYNVPILKAAQNSEDFSYLLATYLRKRLAHSISKHGVLIEIYGEGVLLLGKSGIGKTEIAIDLIKRGHILVADDSVIISRLFPYTLVGGPPPRIKHLAEIRGIGIINYRKIFGISSVKDSTNIDLIVNLENWDDNTEYERLGFKEIYEEILGVQVPSLTIPVTAGRNIAMILEVAVINNRRKRMDRDSLYNKIDQFK